MAGTDSGIRMHGTAAMGTPGSSSANSSRGTFIRWSARLGYAARGIVYLGIGAMAVLAALDAGGQTTGSRGALASLTDETFGHLLIGLVGLGLVGYAAWRAVQALFDADRENDLLDLALGGPVRTQQEILHHLLRDRRGAPQTPALGGLQSGGAGPVGQRRFDCAVELNVIGDDDQPVFRKPRFWLRILLGRQTLVQLLRQQIPKRHAAVFGAPTYERALASHGISNVPFAYCLVSVNPRTGNSKSVPSTPSG